MRIGMIGHRDAGKTDTAQALTKLVGAQIPWDTPAKEVPTWLCQGETIDGLILVVSAMDGPMPSTRKHLALAGQVAVPVVGIWINKLDMFDRGPELLEIIEMETRDLMAACGVPDEDVPCAMGSSRRALSDIEQGNSSDRWTRPLLDLWEAVGRYVEEVRR